MLLVLNDTSVFPIRTVEFNGAIDTDRPSPGVPFRMFKGSIFFSDTWGAPHLMRYDGQDSAPPKQTQEQLWAQRLAAQDKFREEEGLPPVTDPIKRMLPAEAEKIQEKDRPGWMRDDKRDDLAGCD